jgi:hypothetical protein
LHYKTLDGRFKGGLSWLNHFSSLEALGIDRIEKATRMVPLNFAVGHIRLPELHVLYLRFAAMSDIGSELRSTGVPELRTIRLLSSNFFRVLRKSTAIQHMALEMLVNRWYLGAMEKEIVGCAQDVARRYGEAEDEVRSLHVTELDFKSMYRGTGTCYTTVRPVLKRGIRSYLRPGLNLQSSSGYENILRTRSIM